MDRLWDETKNLVRAFRLPHDPLRKGGILRILENQKASVEARERLTEIAGEVIREVVNRERSLEWKKRSRRKAADMILSASRDNPELRHAKAGVIKANIAVRLERDDDEIAVLEDSVSEWKGLKEFVGLVLDHAKASKEVQRQQVDLIRDERNAVRGFKAP